MNHDIDATTLKRFFKTQFGIPVRVQSSSGKAGWINVRIAPEKSESHRDPLRYAHAFPPALGNRCMRIVYAGNKGLCEQNWSGNISAHSISMVRRQWEQLFRELVPQVEETPLEVS